MLPRAAFGSTGLEVSRLGFGAWAIGGSWGASDDDVSADALRRALDAGCSFLDTADVYGDGRSERIIAGEKRPGVLVATKAGRRLPKQAVEGYTREALEAWTARSRKNLGVETLDLLQLHCPPTALYRERRVFDLLDGLVREGKIRHYGVSVETIEEAKLALAHPIQSIQIIFNLFRQRPSEELFAEAARRRVAIIARVPLASGLLSGRITPATTFAADDHRVFNRHGEAFDVGETFSGVPLEAAWPAIEELRALVPAGWTLAQFALRWILMHEAVTVVIPGCRTPTQVDANLRAAAMPALDVATMRACREIYDRRLRPLVHGRW